MKRRNVLLGLLLSAVALAAADDLPKGDAILDKYIEATGGKAAYDKVRSDVATGTMTFAAMGLTGKMVAYAQAPDKQLVEITLEGVGKLMEGATGDLAWGYSAVQGPRIKEGEEKAMALRQAKFNADANWRDIYKSAETTGSETIDGKDCYKVLLTSKDGKTSTRWYEKKSNLLTKMAMTTNTAMGEISVEVFPSDYRKEGDILLPHKSTNKAMGQEFTMVIEKVEQNAEIPKDKFDPPAEVKALIKPGAKQ